MSHIYKILFYIGSLHKGGAERVLTNLAGYFSEKGYEAYFITTVPPDKDDYEINNKIKDRSFLDDQLDNIKKGKILKEKKRFCNLIKICKRIEPDLIISFTMGPIMRSLIVSNLLKIPIVISIRNDPSKEIKGMISKIIRKVLYPTASGIVFQTRDAQAFFSKKIIEKSAIIPNPINTKYIKKSFDGEREKNIVAVGRLEYQKNFILLIKAFEKIKYFFDDYQLIIYGKGSLKEKLSNYCEKNNLENSVIFAGTVDDLEKKIYKASLFVMTSDYEGMPNALMEAMAMGLPVIATDCPCGGPRFLINNGINGKLVPTNNCEKLVDAMYDILNDQKKAKEIGKEAEKISEQLSPNKIYRQWEEYILEILNS